MNTTAAQGIATQALALKAIANAYLALEAATEAAEASLALTLKLGAFDWADQAADYLTDLEMLRAAASFTSLEKRVAAKAAFDAAEAATTAASF